MSSQATPEAPAPASAPKARVMVADDSRVMRLAVKKILGAEFDLVQAENGLQAWEQICQDATIQALVSDIEMPGLDGYELICRIRASDDERIRDLPVITITGADDEVTKQRAFACGATDFITKPLDSIQLLARVQAYARYDQTTRELAEQAEVLEEQSIADMLTGLPSRRYLIQRGEQDVAFARRHGKDLAMIRVDIDGFKQHYRTLGDEGSDRLLAWVAKMLIDNARTEDTVARIAGSEFAIHANGISLDEAMVICNRITTSLAKKPFVDGSHSITVTLSIGVASLGQDRASDVDMLLRLATQRALHARAEGGNRICSLIPGQLPAEVEELTLGAPEDSSVLAVDVEPSELALSEPAPASEPTEPEIELTLDSGLSLTIEEETPGADSGVLAADSLDIPGELSMSLADAPETPNADVPTDSGTELPSASPDLISIDKALLLLAKGHEKALLPYLEGLVRQVQPLLDLHQRSRNRR